MNPMRWSRAFLTMAAAGVIAGSGVAIAATAKAPQGSAAAKVSTAAKKGAASPDAAIRKIVKTEEEWKKTLTPEQYRILRQKGTERAFTGQYWDHHAKGVYRCAACGLDLFDSKTKFESGTGWPSFWAPIAPGHVAEHMDTTLGMVRVEVLCARCGGHLGHLFDDGPAPTGLRYCMNSASLAFTPAP